MNILRKDWHISRRTMLKGFGACMGLPLLEAMFTRDAHADTAWPIRMGVLYMPNGCHPTAWTPEGAGANFQLSEVLKPLEKTKSDINVFTELWNKGANQGDGHYFKESAFLCGTTITKTAKGEDLSSGGISLDQYVAQQAGQTTRLPSIELGTEPVSTGVDNNVGITRIYGGHMSWSTPTTPVPKEILPQQAFDRLFRSQSSGIAAAVASAAKAAPAAEPTGVPITPADDRSLLDAVKNEATQLRNRLGVADQRKLDEYLTAVRDVERRIHRENTKSSGGAGNEPFKVDPLAIQEFNFLGQRVKAYAGKGRGGNHQEHCRLMMDIMVLGFWTDSTRVGTFMFGNSVSGKNFSFVDGVTGGHHDMSHHENKADKLEQYKKINRWHVEQYAYMIEKMKGIKEGNRTLLDNSMVLFGSAIRDGNAHNAHNLPVILAGKAGGTIVTGRHLVYRKDTPLSNLYLDMAVRMGCKIQKFADSTGPLKGLNDPAFAGEGKA